MPHRPSVAQGRRSLCVERRVSVVSWSRRVRRRRPEICASIVRMRSSLRWSSLVVAVTLVITACGGGDSDDADTSNDANATADVENTSAADGGGDEGEGGGGSSDDAPP